MYHINPATGNANLCRATVRCRFGDLREDHYSTKAQAQRAYARRQKQAHLEGLRKERELLTAGHDPFPEALGRKLQAEAEELFASFQQEGSFLLPEADEEVEATSSYTFVASGSYNNTYLSPDGTTVYKVPNSFAAPQKCLEAGDEGQEETQRYVRELMREYQENYASFSTALLREEGAEYAPTYFIPVECEGGSYMMMAQPYLNDKDYESFTEPYRDETVEDFSSDEFIHRESLSDEEWEAKGWGLHPRLLKPFEKLGLIDIHQGNYKRRRSDGVIVFFDCV